MKIDQDLIDACERLIKSIDEANLRKEEQRKAQEAKKANIDQLREIFYGDDAPTMTFVV